VVGLVTASGLRPLLSHSVVTSQRVVAYSTADVSRVGFKAQVLLADVASVELRRSRGRLVQFAVLLRDGASVAFGDMQHDDAQMMLQLVLHLIGSAGGSPRAAWRFNAPPGWPVPPEGWVPPAGWQPDPAWPPSPPGWQLWVPATQQPLTAAPPVQAPRPAPPGSYESVPPATTALPAAAEHPSTAPARGLFGSKKRAAELEAENTELRGWIENHQGMDALQLSRETDELREQVSALRQRVAEQNRVLDQVLAQVVATEDIALLQEAGIYEYRHPLSDAVEFRSRLEKLKDTYKSLARSGDAVLASTNWEVNGSVSEGRRMVRDFSKLMLRAYNAEVDSLVRTMRPYKLQASIDRLGKTVETIARLGKTMSIRVNPTYHQYRITELELTADYLAKVEEEKERVREERERQREEQKAQREFEREKARLLKERSHYVAALSKVEANSDLLAVEELRAKLADVDKAITDVEGREANIRAGYVYVISNVGAFGEHMVKVGMTRRLEPMDRVRELGDASVPFRFDVHALIFSEDAVGLETRLHHALADRRVNLVNLRREFFYATPSEVRTVVEEIAGQHVLEYTETPEAVEWRASDNQRAGRLPEQTAGIQPE